MGMTEQEESAAGCLVAASGLAVILGIINSALLGVIFMWLI